MQLDLRSVIYVFSYKYDDHHRLRHLVIFGVWVQWVVHLNVDGYYYSIIHISTTCLTNWVTKRGNNSSPLSPHPPQVHSDPSWYIQLRTLNYDLIECAFDSINPIQLGDRYSHFWWIGKNWDTWRSKNLYISCFQILKIFLSSIKISFYFLCDSMNISFIWARDKQVFLTPKFLKQCCLYNEAPNDGENMVSLFTLAST